MKKLFPNGFVHSTVIEGFFQVRFPASVEFSTMRELVFSKFSTFYSTFVENSEKKGKTNAENLEFKVF